MRFENLEMASKFHLLFTIYILTYNNNNDLIVNTHSHRAYVLRALSAIVQYCYQLDAARDGRGTNKKYRGTVTRYSLKFAPPYTKIKCTVLPTSALLSTCYCAIT